MGGRKPQDTGKTRPIVLYGHVKANKALKNYFDMSIECKYTLTVIHLYVIHF